MADVDETTVRLPHTGMWVPDRIFTVSNYKEIKTHCGVAYTANLRRNRKLVGIIENSGTGGMTFFHADDYKVFGERDLEEYAGRCRTAEGERVTVEDLLEQLVSEADWDRRIKRAATRGRMEMRLMDASDPILPPWSVIQWGCTVPRNDKQWVALAHQIVELPEARPQDGQWWQGWDGKAWRDVTERPKHVNAELYG